jgi:alpha-2-macroglobulin
MSNGIEQPSTGAAPSSAGAVPWWRRGWARWLGGLLVVALAATPLLLTGDDDDGGDGSGDTPPTAAGEGDDMTEGPLRLRLQEGRAVAMAGDEVAVVDGEGLSQSRIDAVVDRLEPFAGEVEDRAAFNRPAETLPPPVAGETVATTFPPDPPGSDAPPQPDAVPAGPLEVLRVQPEGEVDIAPFLSLTFSQPMIPLATLEQLDAADVPVTVSPELPGRWRWIGTRTLRFEHSSEGAAPQVDRLPMATEYTVTVPAGTTSASGDELAEAVSFTFATPPPTVLGLSPQGESLPLQPVFVATFDQVVDPAAVLEHVAVEADGNRAVRLATEAEIEADEAARRIVEQALDGRWVAFRPAEPLPADTPLTATVGAGTPSAEGPRISADDQTFRGRTFPPLRIERTDCGYGGGCQPGQPLVITFSNPLDAAAFDPATITVEPALPGASIQIRGPELVVVGATEADTTYRITVPAALRDERGQTLGEA